MKTLDRLNFRFGYRMARLGYISAANSLTLCGRKKAIAAWRKSLIRYELMKAKESLEVSAQ